MEQVADHYNATDEDLANLWVRLARQTNSHTLAEDVKITNNFTQTRYSSKEHPR